MSDAPKTIWIGRWPHGRRYWREEKPEAIHAKEYTLTSSVAAQLKAADELADMVELYDDNKATIYQVIGRCLAYRATKPTPE